MNEDDKKLTPEGLPFGETNPRRVTLRREKFRK